MKPLTEKDLVDGELTPLGSLMCLLPMDFSMSRLVMMGYCFGFLEEAVIIACGMHQQGFFSEETVLADDECGQLQDQYLITIFPCFPTQRNLFFFCDRNRCLMSKSRANLN